MQTSMWRKPVETPWQTILPGSGAWLAYIFIVVSFIALFSTVLISASLNVMVFGAFFVGMSGALFAANTGRDILVRPMSFCMPNHAGSIRHHLLSFGFGIAIFYSLICFKVPVSSINEKLGALYCLAALSGSIYLLFAHFLFRYPSASMLYWCVLGVFILFLKADYDFTPASLMLVSSPLILSLVFAVSLMGFLKIFEPANLRKIFDAAHFSMSEPMAKNSFENYRQTMRLKEKARSIRNVNEHGEPIEKGLRLFSNIKVKSLFDSQMRLLASMFTNKFSSKIVWGNILGAILLQVVIQYNPGTENLVEKYSHLFMMLCYAPYFFLSIKPSCNAVESILLPYGRIERWHTEIKLGLAYCVLASTLCLLLLNICWWLISPEYYWVGKGKALKGMAFCIFMMPVMFSVGLLIFKKVQANYYMLVFLPIFGLSALAYNNFYLGVGWLGGVLCQIVCWGGYIGMSYVRYTRIDFVAER